MTVTAGPVIWGGWGVDWGDAAVVVAVRRTVTVVIGDLGLAGFGDEGGDDGRAERFLDDFELGGIAEDAHLGGRHPASDAVGKVDGEPGAVGGTAGDGEGGADLEVDEGAAARGGVKEATAGKDAERGWPAEYGETGVGGQDRLGRVGAGFSGWHGRGGEGRLLAGKAGAKGFGDLLRSLGGGICLGGRAEIGRGLDDACARRERGWLARAATAGGQQEEEAEEKQGVADKGAEGAWAQRGAGQFGSRGASKIVGAAAQARVTHIAVRRWG